MSRPIRMVLLLVAALFFQSGSLSLPLVAAAEEASPLVSVATSLKGGLEEEFPTNLTLRAAIFANKIPLAFTKYHQHKSGNNNNETTTATTPTTTTPSNSKAFVNLYENPDDPYYKGFMPDIARELQTIAYQLDQVQLNFEVEEAKDYAYSDTFDYLATNCNTTKNAHPLDDCHHKYDLIIGDYYASPQRSIRAALSPPLTTTAAAVMRFLHRTDRRDDIATLAEAQAVREPVCLLYDSYYDIVTLKLFPDLLFARCYTHEQCIQYLKDELCVLFVEDELQLQYWAVQDPALEVTRESFHEQYIVWPMNYRLKPLYQQMLIRWIYQAKVTGVLDALYDKYFSVNYCPFGKAGKDCELKCSPTRGTSDRYGNCVCESTRWTGDDCTVEVMEDKNLIPRGLLWTSYGMVALNFGTALMCAMWLVCNRNRAQIQMAQPSFLMLVLLGCLISTSTIIALSQEHEGEGPVHACMAIPWLYSVGFSITFGTLFAKIRRLYLLMKSAQSFRRVIISVQETCCIILGVCFIDIVILLSWSLIDPLEWQRNVLTMDKYGYPLSSQGLCTSQHWAAFAGAIAIFHFVLMVLGCWLSYKTRNLPFSEGRYVAIAMVSNLQIFVVGVPVLAILGSDSQTSFFVRSVIIWMNDFVVVTLIFGRLMFSIYHPSIQQQSGNDSQDGVPIKDSSEKQVQQAIQNYVSRQSHRRMRSLASDVGRSSNLSMMAATSSCDQPKGSREFSVSGASSKYTSGASNRSVASYVDGTDLIPHCHQPEACPVSHISEVSNIDAPHSKEALAPQDESPCLSSEDKDDDDPRTICPAETATEPESEPATASSELTTPDSNTQQQVPESPNLPGESASVESKEFKV